ncbi:MAG TPA: LuxR C-terminal-related transcriptional regulator, partial [Acidimicrobiia bacterium]|nr:LuxR C-terminal-related transcriptional regulator [Acidimicrobiia bacterium]
PYLRALAARADGVVLSAQGSDKEALVELRRALNALQALGARYDAACTRVFLARVCDAIGDHDAADMELASARTAFAVLGAGLAGTREGAPDGLSKRELEVLMLLAQGRTNRGIAEALFISEKTVASHVSHVFTKIGVTTRSAATAYAYDRNLV